MCENSIGIFYSRSLKDLNGSSIAFAVTDLYRAGLGAGGSLSPSLSSQLIAPLRGLLFTRLIVPLIVVHSLDLLCSAKGCGVWGDCLNGISIALTIRSVDSRLRKSERYNSDIICTIIQAKWYYPHPKTEMQQILGGTSD